MYLCQRYTGQRLKDIGRHFDIGESGVSQASRRIIQKKKEDKQFKKRIEKIEKKISSK
jgi:chromosomal replication initiation ATPase DnaA